MGTITALSAQKRAPDRVNVFLDGEFAFALAYPVAARLQVGQALADNDITLLLGQDAIEKGKEHAAGYLSYRPRSQAEVQRHLQKKGYDEETIQHVIARLVAVELLNDETFARYWVEQRETFKPRGRLALRQELQQKGVHRSIIDAVLADTDESAAVQQAAAQKIRQLAELPEAEFKRKLGQYLYRRGFSYEIIQSALVEAWAAVDAPTSSGPDHPTQI